MRVRFALIGFLLVALASPAAACEPATSTGAPATSTAEVPIAPVGPYGGWLDDHTLHFQLGGKWTNVTVPAKPLGAHRAPAKWSYQDFLVAPLTHGPYRMTQQGGYNQGVCSYTRPTLRLERTSDQQILREWPGLGFGNVLEDAGFTLILDGPGGRVERIAWSSPPTIDGVEVVAGDWENVARVHGHAVSFWDRRGTILVFDSLNETSYAIHPQPWTAYVESWEGNAVILAANGSAQRVSMGANGPRLDGRLEIGGQPGPQSLVAEGVALVQGNSVFAIPWNLTAVHSSLALAPGEKVAATLYPSDLAEGSTGTAFLTVLAGKPGRAIVVAPDLTMSSSPLPPAPSSSISSQTGVGISFVSLPVTLLAFGVALATTQRP